MALESARSDQTLSPVPQRAPFLRWAGCATGHCDPLELVFDQVFNDPERHCYIEPRDPTRSIRWAENLVLRCIVNAWAPQD